MSILPTPTPRSLRILFAENNALVAAMIKAAIERIGHTCEVAEDGQLALNLICGEPHRFDLVVTDQSMPKLSGLGLVAKLRDTTFAGHIVVLTTSLSPLLEADFRSHGVEHFLTKPLTFAALSECLCVISASA